MALCFLNSLLSVKNSEHSLHSNIFGIFKIFLWVLGLLDGGEKLTTNFFFRDGGALVGSTAEGVFLIVFFLPLACGFLADVDRFADCAFFGETLLLAGTFLAVC